MACPFFLPSKKIENGSWLHPLRLPLGCGWSGVCTAPGHDGEAPSSEELQHFCNMGYAADCSRIPRERSWDSIRFGARAVAGEANARSQRLFLQYVCERNHLPAEHGSLEFDPAQNVWLSSHPDPRIQRMAECFAASYLERKSREVQSMAS